LEQTAALAHGELCGRTHEHRSLLQCVALYVPIWLSSGGILAVLVGAMYSLPLSELPPVFVAQCAGGTLGMLVLLLPSGFGLNELAISVILSTVIPGPAAVLAALAMRVITTANDLLWSALGLGFLRLAGAEPRLGQPELQSDQAPGAKAKAPVGAELGESGKD
jgi:uncharacterized membrane protein YbhN (UPF0104 family)